MTVDVAQDQSAVFAFLGDPRSYGLSTSVTRIDTHGAVVFLAGEHVYKIKRAVRFPFMDFSTLERRRAACEAEIAVNRANAPHLYLGVVAITRSGDALRFGGDGEIVEWAVHLRRFDETATLDRLAMNGPLGHELIDKLAHAVNASHRRAPLRDAEAATAALRRHLRETVDALVKAEDMFSSPQATALALALMNVFDQSEQLLLRRGKRGQVRRCHGDLHLRNIALIGGQPVLFDAIEFDEAIATSDVLYDLAFLLMDLCERGLRDDANLLMNRYLWSCEDERLQVGGLALMPMFLSLRAAIRAKVAVAQFRLDSSKRTLHDEARAYFNAAIKFLHPASAQLVAIGGLSGSGKSTLAAAVAPALGRAPGALHLRSDIERKRRFRVGETERLPPDAYAIDVSNAIYDELHQLGALAIHGGYSAIVDATYRDPADRTTAARTAAAARVPFIGVWLDAPMDVLTKRAAARSGDASDATPTVVVAQSAQDIGPMTWRRLDATSGLDQLRSMVLNLCDAHDNGQTTTQSGAD